VVKALLTEVKDQYRLINAGYAQDSTLRILRSSKWFPNSLQSVTNQEEWHPTPVTLYPIYKLAINDIQWPLSHTAFTL